MKPLFSIIIPAYNIGDLVKDAIDSCLNQKDIYPDEFEIIVVNDGSTDNTASFISAYENVSNVIVITQKNGGLSNARNNGILISKGKYILFLDGDDWLAENALSTLKSVANEDEIIEFPLIYWFDSDNHEVKGCGIAPGLYSTAEFLHLTLGKSKFHEIPAQKKLYPSKILREQNLRFLEGIYHEDNPFFVDVMMNTEKVRYIDDAIYYYRQNRVGSITSRKTIRNFNGIIQGKDYLLQRYGYENRDVVHLLSNMCVFQLVGEFSDDNHKASVMTYFRQPHIKLELLKMLSSSRCRIKSQIRLTLLLIDPYILWKIIQLM